MNVNYWPIIWIISQINLNWNKSNDLHNNSWMQWKVFTKTTSIDPMHGISGMHWKSDIISEKSPKYWSEKENKKERERESIIKVIIK